MRTCIRHAVTPLCESKGCERVSSTACTHGPACRAPLPPQQRLICAVAPRMLTANMSVHAGARHHLPGRRQRPAAGAEYCACAYCGHPWPREHQPPGRHHRPRPHLRLCRGVALARHPARGAAAAARRALSCPPPRGGCDWRARHHLQKPCVVWGDVFPRDGYSPCRPCYPRSGAGREYYSPLAALPGLLWM